MYPHVVLRSARGPYAPEILRIPADTLRLFLTLALLLSSFAAGKSASVAPGVGYTNDFSIQPSVTDWATASVPGNASDNYDLEYHLNTTVSASKVNSQTMPNDTLLPGANALANWSSPGHFLQTRPTGVKYTLLLATFTNNTGLDATHLAISYSLTIAGGGAAEDTNKGTRVYYSFTGLPGTWTNIPSLNTMSSTDGTSSMSANLAVNWRKAGSFYLLWVDDNADFRVDAANQIDNFSLQVTGTSLNPVITAITPQPGCVSALSNITVAFSESVTNVDASDLLLNGKPASALTMLNTNLFLFSFPPLTNYGLVNISWAANHGIVDLEFPPNSFDATASGSTWQYSLVNPNVPYLVSVTPARGASTNHLTQLTVTFNEAVAGVDAGDLLINGNPATNLNGAGSTYTFMFSQPAFGSVAITWAANHAIHDLETPANDFDPSAANHSWSYTLVDQIPPAVSAQTPAAGSSVLDLASITVIFTEPVIGVQASDLQINGQPATSVTGANAQYVFSFPQPNASVINVTWSANNVIHDLAPAPNGFIATAQGNSWSYPTVDDIPPALVTLGPSPSASLNSLQQITMLFNEPVQGVSPNSLFVNGQPAREVLGDGAGPYTFRFDQPPGGLVQVAFGAGITDLATPPNAYNASNWTYTLDTNVPPPNLTRGPYLQMQSSNGMLIRWRTSDASWGRVRYGPTAATLTNAVPEAVFTTEHAVWLTNLAPNTRYFYGFENADGALFSSTNFCFSTAPVAAQPTRIWVIGDNRLTSSSSSLQMNSNAVRVKDAFLQFAGKRSADFSLNTGDLGGRSGTDVELQLGFFDTYPEVLRQSVLWVCLGNHDMFGAYQYDFTLPAAGECGGVPSGDDNYYSFNYGNIHVVALDSEMSDKSVNGPMYKWLQQDLARNRSDWLIAFWHSPPYSRSWSHDSDREGNMATMRTNFVPLLEDFGVDLVLGGHNHLYERTYLIDGHYGTSDTFTSAMAKDSGDGREEGTGPYRKPSLPHAGAVYATVGNSGAELYTLQTQPGIFFGESAFGSLVVDVVSNRLEATFLRDTGEVHDHFTIIKSPPVELSVTHARPQITISWTATATNYVLQASPAIGPSLNWQSITQGITSTDNKKIYSFTPAPQQTAVFFRLQQTR